MPSCSLSLKSVVLYSERLAQVAVLLVERIRSIQRRLGVGGLSVAKYPEVVRGVIRSLSLLMGVMPTSQFVSDCTSVPAPFSPAARTDSGEMPGDGFQRPGPDVRPSSRRRRME